MSVARHPARLVLSIDVDPDVARHDTAAVRDAEAAATTLLRQMTDHQLSATWAVSDLSARFVSERLALSTGQEIAILGDSSWAGADVPRGLLSAALGRRIEKAAHLPHQPQTLVVHDGGLPEDLDVLVKNGIRAVRTSPPAREVGLLRTVAQLLGSVRRISIDAQPKSVRWGVAELSASYQLPDCGIRRAQRAIRRAVAERTLMHLAIDLPRVQASAIERVLQTIVRARDEGNLHVVAIAGLLNQLVAAQQGRPARSILRRAA
jgi:hypothetical protein